MVDDCETGAVRLLEVSTILLPKFSLFPDVNKSVFVIQNNFQIAFFEAIKLLEFYSYSNPKSLSRL
jgi:hypothetical protein